MAATTVNTTPTSPNRSAGESLGPLFNIVPLTQLRKAHSSRTVGYPLLRRNGPLTSAPIPGAPSRSTVTPRTSSKTPSTKIAIYNNLNNPGMSDAINGATPGAPPDSTGAIGPNHYVEMVNSAIEVWHRDLTPAASTSLAAFIGDTPPQPYCDPQIQWDPSAGRWLFVFLYCNPANMVQFFVFGWSRTADPSNLNLTTGWCAFGVNTARTLFDYPKLGHNSKYMIVGGNMY